MSVAATKTWIDAEILTHTDLNARFVNIESQTLPAASQSEVNSMELTSVGLHPNHNLIVLGTQVASTSGTSITFSSIPSGVRKIQIMFSSVSTSGTSNIMVQIGDVGGVETSSYLGAATTITSATPATANFTTGFGVTATTLAAGSLHGVVTLTLMNNSTNTWAATSIMGHSNATTISIGAGAKATSAELDRVVITTVGGADTFDGGAINISYER
jgi:hypothetical protein